MLLRLHGDLAGALLRLLNIINFIVVALQSLNQMRFTFAIRHSSSSIRYLFLILGLNIPFILYLYSFHGMPNSPVYLRNTFFVKPLSLRSIGTYAQLPPRQPLTKSSSTYDDALIAEHVQKILPLCPSRTVSCLAKTLGASLAVLRKPTDFECRNYSTRHSAHKVVFPDGYGCCTDFVHTFILSSNHLGITARAVHTPGHTTAEFWDPKSRRWIWLDPFLGYQAFDTASAAFGLSHFEIFTNFLAGKKVHFNKISSQLSQSIPDSDSVRQILNPVSYHRINNPESDIEMGLLAQEVEATLARHGLGNSGMVHQPTEDAYMSIRYNDLLAPMIKAIQELDAQHKQEVTSLQEQLQSQQEELLAIVESQQEQIAQLQRMVEHQFVVN